MKEKKTNLIHIVAESGGSKTDWLLARSDKATQQLTTSGMNPNTVSQSTIRQLLQQKILPWIKGEDPIALYFFGAGLGQSQNRQLLNKIFQEVFCSRLEKLQLETDLLAAAYATLGRQAGIIAILGTGSVVCYYDGKKIQQRCGGWGPALGDEGGAVMLGHRLLRCYFQEHLPPDLHKHLQHFAKANNKEEMLAKVYQKSPWEFFRKQCWFLQKYKHHPWIQNLLVTEWQEFFQLYLLPLLAKEQLPVIFLGGIAHGFASELTQLSLGYQLRDFEIYKEAPISGLYNYLAEHHFSKGKGERKSLPNP